MCGLTGFIDYSKNKDSTTLNKMVRSLQHRGPNDFGAELYNDESASIGLGQTRLSIIDISAQGHQPMEYKSLSIVFNGEVYNYVELKEKLIKLGHKFISNSDTEVVLHAFEEWGANCVDEFIGMFAMVIYDKQAQFIYAFRDRAGVKPLFYYQKEGLFMFSSELKAFHQHPNFNKEINIDALYAYFDYGYVPSPYTIFEDTHKLDAGHYLEFDLKKNEFSLKEYWDPKRFYFKPKLTISYEEAKEELHDLLKSAYNYRMVSDVPVGVFLSGGYDSVSVAAILQSTHSKPLKTFTIGFNEGNNEAPYAKEIAKYLGTDHHEFYCTEKKCQDIIPELPYYYDEPFADSSAIPTTLVSRFAKEHVTVALSADAGDEVFAGYNAYTHLENRVSKLKRIPTFIRPISKSILKGTSEVVPNSKPSLKHKLYGLSHAMNKNDLELALGLFHESKILPIQYRKRFIKEKEGELLTKFKVGKNQYDSALEMIMAIDYQTYLQNDILVKVDRATMSTSLEGREPLVDHRILEFAAQLPLSYKYNGKTSKRILKDIVHQYIPKEMMDRPKSGFSLPIYKWLQNDLSYLVEEHLSPESLNLSGLFNVEFLNEQVNLFKKDNFHYKPFIWKLLMFQMWYKKWM